MERQKKIKADIEKQREKMDCMAAQARNLTELVEEAQEMDRLVAAYEDECTIS